MLNFDENLGELIYSPGIRRKEYMKREPRLDYHAYILRFWAEEDGHPDKRTWRFMLQNTSSGEQKCFPSLEELTAYLKEEKLSVNSNGQ